jgi:hypothetical protein
MKRTNTQEELTQLLYIESKLIEYIYSREYTINFQSSWFAIYKEDQVITCNSRCKNAWLRTISLAHEAGHINADRPNFMKSWRKCKTSIQSSILHEEWLAWEHGWSIIEHFAISQLSSDIDINFYNQLQIQYWKCARQSWSKYIECMSSSSSNQLREIAESYW